MIHQSREIGVKPHHESDSDTTLIDCIVRAMQLTPSGCWPWLGDLRAAGERRGIPFVQIITYFEAHPPRLETFLAECPAGRADLAIQDVLNAIGAE